MILISVIPVTMALLIYGLIYFWNASLVVTCEIDFDYSSFLDPPAWNNIQYTFKCCGQHNYSDWGHDIPKSCSEDRHKECNENNVYKNGCHPFIKTTYVNMVRSATLPFQYIFMISIPIFIALSRHMFGLVFPKYFARGNQNYQGILTEPDLEAGSIEDHNDGDEEEDCEYQDDGDDEQLLEDPVQNDLDSDASFPTDTELLEDC